MILDPIVKRFNDLRLDNKDKWVTFSGVMHGFDVRYKAFNTSIQILNISNTEHGSAWDLKVAEFKDHIYKSFEYAINSKEK